MILRGGLFLFCLFKGVLDLLGLIWAWQFFPWVLFYSCFLPLSLSLVPSLLAYFPSAFGKPSDEKEENKHQGSCNHTGLSSFSAEQAEPSFQQQRRGTVASPVLCPAQVLYVAEDGGLAWAGTARGWGKRSVAVQKRHETFSPVSGEGVHLFKVLPLWSSRWQALQSAGTVWLIVGVSL